MSVRRPIAFAMFVFLPLLGGCAHIWDHGKRTQNGPAEEPRGSSQGSIGVPVILNGKDLSLSEGARAELRAALDEQGFVILTATRGADGRVQVFGTDGTNVPPCNEVPGSLEGCNLENIKLEDISSSARFRASINPDCETQVYGPYAYSVHASGPRKGLPPCP